MCTHLSISEQFTPISSKTTPLNLHYVTISLYSLIFQQVSCFWSCSSKAIYLWRLGHASKSTTSMLATLSKGIALSSEQPSSESVLLLQGAWCLEAKQNLCRHWTPIYKDHSSPMGMLRMQTGRKSKHPRDPAFPELHKKLHLRLKTTSFNLCISTEIFTYG